MNELLSEKTYFKKCSTCKKEIPFKSKYKICSVSTCQNKKTGLVFCSLPCWDAHLGFANHRSSGALEITAPSREEFLRETQTPETTAPLNHEPKRNIISTPATSHPSVNNVDVLVVVSKVKGFIRDQSEFNTSQCAIDALTQKVVQECFKAIENAKIAGRKTVMGRDF